MMKPPKRHAVTRPPFTRKGPGSQFAPIRNFIQPIMMDLLGRPWTGPSPDHDASDPSLTGWFLTRTG
jgi:hypothetical protein